MFAKQSVAYMHVHLSMNGDWDLLERVRGREGRSTPDRGGVAGRRRVVRVGRVWEGGGVRDGCGGRGGYDPRVLVTTWSS